MPPTLDAAQETLRKYSVVPVVTRMCAQDTTLDGVPIPAGCYIACLLQVSHLLPTCLQTCKAASMSLTVLPNLAVTCTSSMYMSQPGWVRAACCLCPQRRSKPVLTLPHQQAAWDSSRPKFSRL